jgi:hypothetical protein
MGHGGEINVDQAHRGYNMATDEKGYASVNPLFWKPTRWRALSPPAHPIHRMNRCACAAGMVTLATLGATPARRAALSVIRCAELRDALCRAVQQLCSVA